MAPSAVVEVGGVGEVEGVVGAEDTEDTEDMMAGEEAVDASGVWACASLLAFTLGELPEKAYEYIYIFIKTLL